MSDKPIIKITTVPADLFKRISELSRFIDKMMGKTMDVAMEETWVASYRYPPQPAGSTYVRTGDLGASLGKTMAGQKLGTPPAIYTKRSVQDGMDAQVGSNIWYANRVIGDQEFPWKAYWWSAAGKWKKRATTRIKKALVGIEREIEKYFYGRGL